MTKSYSEEPERNIELFFSLLIDTWTLWHRYICDYFVSVMNAVLCNMFLWIGFHPKLSVECAADNVYLLYCMSNEGLIPVKEEIFLYKCT